MRNWPLWTAALWWGCLSTLGFGVVPLLFVHLPSAAVAGTMAAHLFEAQTVLSLALGLALLLAAVARRGDVLLPRGASVLWFVAAAMALALASQWVVAPRILAREDLRLWHALGSAMYVGQWLCAGLIFRAWLKPREQAQV